MILVKKKLDFITVNKIREKTGFVGVLLGIKQDKNLITGVILDTRPFDITQYPNLKVISRVGVGVDNIDLEECRKRNIKVYTTPCQELAYSVAEFTIKQLLNLMSVNNLRDSLFNKVVVIIGNGIIGYRTGQLLRFLGCKIFFYDVLAARSHFKQYEELLSFLPQADIVSVHVSGTDCVLGKKEIDLLKDGCYVLNMARRGCVDFEYVLKSIVGGRNIKYASDVDSYRGFSLEAVEFSCNFSSLINNRVKQSILLTPHIASKTVAARKAMENMALDNLVRGLSE